MSTDKNFGTVSRFRGVPSDAKPEDFAEVEITKDRYKRLDFENHYHHRAGGNNYYTTYYEHESTGIITSDPFKLEEFFDNLRRTQL